MDSIDTNADDEGMAPALHGTLPLARDPGSPLGVRFATEGDAPADLVRDAGGLPDAWLGLRAFGSGETREAYVAALSDTGGNAYSWTTADPRGLPCLLLVARWDRARRPGTALDEAVEALGDVPAAARSFARARGRAREDAERRDAERRAREKWASASAVVSGRFTLILSRSGDDGLEFVSTDTGARYRLGGDPSTPRLAFKARMHPVIPSDPDWQSSLSGLGPGIGIGKDGSVTLPAGPFDDAALARAEDIAREVGRIADRLANTARGRRVVKAILADANALRALSDLATGLPILEPVPGAKAAQLSLRTGAARRVTGTALGELVRAGFVRQAWAPDPKDPVWGRAPGLYVATPAGLALVRGDHEAAIAGVRDYPHRPRPDDPPPPGPALPEALDALRGEFPADAPARIAAALPPGACVGTFPPRTSDPDAWVLPVAALLARTVVPGRAGRFAAAEDEPAPGPRP